MTDKSSTGTEGLKDWQESNLGKYVKVQGGFAFKSTDFTDSGVPVIKIKNVRPRYIDVEEADCVSVSVAQSARNYFLSDGDVIISMTGSGPNAPNSVVGRVARYTGESGRYLINQRVGRFIVKDSSKIDKRFLFFLLSQKEIQDWLVSNSTGSANQANISNNQIESLRFIFPPILEQISIADILGALDDKIELNQRMNETLEAIARALFKSWFVDFDPVKAKAEGQKPEGMDDDSAALFPSNFTESSLGHLPEGWEASSIGVSFKLTMGQSPPGETYNEDGEGVPFFQGRADFGFRFPIKRIYCTAPTRFAEQNDTLVSVRAPVGDVNIAWDRCCIGRGVAALRHNSGAISFTYYTAKQLQAQFENFNGEGTVFGSINKKDFEKLPHIEPKKDIISLFETIVGAIDSKIRNNEEQIQTLSRTRDQLLPRLLSGKLRVCEISETVEAVAS